MKTIKATVEVYDGSTLVATCTCTDTGEQFPGANSLASFTISREGEMGKFFGFGVSHKLDMTLIDLEKALRIYEGFTGKIKLGNGTLFDEPYPEFTFTSVTVDKKTGDIGITAYDKLYAASELTLEDIIITKSYTIRQLTTAIATALGLTVVGMDSAFDLSYEKGGNYNGDELLRLVLNHIAEATQTIYYINCNDQLVFKRLGTTAVGDYSRDDYYEFETASTKTITGICNATELEDNLEVVHEGGVTQIVRNNGLWDMREDIATLLEQAVNRVEGLSITQFDLDWSGDYRVEIGDLINIHYDEDVTPVYVISDIITYAGTLNEETAWQYVESSSETAANATTIGDKINQTYAKVDKIEKNITLYVGDVVTDAIDNLVPDKIDEHVEGLVTDVDNLKVSQTIIEQKYSQLELTTDGINQTVGKHETKITELENKQTGLDAKITENTTNIGELEVGSNSIVASVETVKETTKTGFEELSEEMSALSQKVSATMTSDQVKILITESLNDGVSSVTTSTGFTFNDEGLHINKSGSDLSSTLDETGLEVNKSGEVILTAKADGVNALNLTSRQYLSVANCRFEKYGSDRMGCYWIGGN